MDQLICWKSYRRTLNKLTVQGTRFLTPAILVCLIGAGVISAQTQHQRNDAESIALKSRAEQAAEQQVALSPEKIIELLRQEPGLLLQVKKMLVRKAYEQGRILDPEDLTDEALFQLLHEDHKICVLATREIEDRAYVRAKPTVEELEQQHERDERLGLTRAVSPSAQKPEGAAAESKPGKYLLGKIRQPAWSETELLRHNRRPSRSSLRLRLSHKPRLQ